MTTAVAAPSVAELCAELERVVDQLTQADLSRELAETVMAAHRSIENCRRRLDGAELRLINDEIDRQLPFEHGCANPTVFLARLLTISRAEARNRVKDAAAFGPRRALTGEPLAPIYVHCADAVTTGAITCRAARAIVTEIEKLPHEISSHTDDVDGRQVGPSVGEVVEHDMVEYARTTDAVEAARFAQAVRYRLDQDGQLRDEQHHQRAREFTIARRRDGSVLITGEGTNELGELFDTVLDTSARPRPATDGTPDPRTPGQRRHDRLREALRDLIACGAPPGVAGCRTTVILRGDVDDFVRNGGSWTTGHGFAVPMALGKTWLEPEARSILVLLSKTKGIEAYSSIDRLFTEQQRLAMHARDLGCTLVDCDRPAAWCEAHHVREYEETGHTRVDEGALVCGEDHRSFAELGWRNVMLDGVPAWVPPKWIDPHQRPRVNTRHRPPRPDRQDS